MTNLQKLTINHYRSIEKIFPNDQMIHLTDLTIKKVEATALTDLWSSSMVKRLKNLNLEVVFNQSEHLRCFQQFEPLQCGFSLKICPYWCGVALSNSVLSDMMQSPVMSMLTSFSLQNMPIKKEGFESIIYCENLSHLVELDVRNCSIKNMIDLKPSKVLKQLKKLDIGLNNELEKQSLELIVGQLESMTHFTYSTSSSCNPITINSRNQYSQQQ